MANAHHSARPKGYTAVIFDLGDVLFTWSPSTPKSPLPAKVLRNILRSHHWFEYEKNNLNEEEVYALVAQEFNITPADAKGAFEAARESLQSSPTMLRIIRELRDAGLIIYAMSNISAPDWEVLRTKATPEEWGLFDRVFTSAAARERKPNIGFFRHVIEQTGVDPSRTIFVDDKLENVLSARSFGMHGVVFDNEIKVIQELKNLCYDPLARGKKYLASHKKKHVSVTSNNIELAENFGQLLILDATGDKSLVEYVKHVGQFNFFKNGGVLTTESFPNDLDTTSIGLTVADHVDIATKHEVMDEMLRYRNSDGIVQVYFDHSRPRIDPVVCVNVLTLFYENDRGHELSGTLDWIEQVLINRAYISGTYYYASADLFLYFVSRLLQTSPEVRRRLRFIFEERIMERFGAEADALSLAARIIAGTIVDLWDKRDLETLLSLQDADGAWRNGWFYKYGASGILIKNDGVTTAMAIRAIQQVRVRRKIRSNSRKTKPKNPFSSDIKQAN
ncbi:HAD-like domain-containing protein [Collybia nuda]|uniref:HAD-like domain-containing protein n=1 Tax=Collybia nuda TaxID=64659 RepID=A0A9P5Y653_9AGAR|nr:HAD-like domain-containing protein [Collybia nuda]